MLAFSRRDPYKPFHPRQAQGRAPLAPQEASPRADIPSRDGTAPLINGFRIGHVRNRRHRRA
ncbi:protein of unknown function [Methylorubrum extorquens]|uniref:Uncharacterized protein n=1 Tax=Methylorubrum extorquens TaxID=408 RepID=A0A2N9AKK5_METEX|nr:protein of unknown function [Methylorubrum extorquens]